MSLFTELKRRNVFRVALAYLIVAWLLVQVGDTLAPALLLPEWTMRFLVFLLLLGFPLALFAAWAVQLTPDGIKLEKSVKREGSGPAPARRKLDALTIALLVIAAAWFAWDKFAVREVAPAQPPVVESSQTSDHRSIVVLPFVNMSGDAEQEYFSDGLSEELLNLLAKIPQLRVTSRSSAFYFKGKDFTIADVGEQLGVDNVLEGSVRRSGDQIRITAQLIDVSSDTHIWSETWDRAFEDVFAVQDEIAAAVTTALKIQLVDELPHAYVTDPRAYDLYLQASDLLATQAEASALAAELRLLELLEIDPTYAPGLVLLGNVEVFLGSWAFRPMEESFARAAEYGRRAVDASSAFAPGYVLLSQLAVRHKRDWPLARRLIDETLRHNPTDLDARLQASMLDMLDGDLDARVDLAQELVQLDPLSGQSHWVLGHALMIARQLDESIAAFRKVLSISPDAAAGHTALGEALFLAGNYEEALLEFDAEPWEGFTQYGRAMTYYRLGDQEKSDTAMQALLDLEDAQWWAAQIALAHGIRGENDEAMKWLDRALELNDQGVLGADVFPLADDLRDDPRFADFVSAPKGGQRPIAASNPAGDGHHRANGDSAYQHRAQHYNTDGRAGGFQHLNLLVVER